MKRSIVIAGLCALLVTPAVRAQSPESLPRLPLLPAGTRVSVTTTAGERIDGEIRLATDTAVTVVDRTGGQRSVAGSEIHSIAVMRRDPIWNGLLAGAALGAAGGAGLGAAWFYGSGRYGAKPPGYERGFISGTAVLGGVVGAIIGWRSDAARSRSEVIYRAHARP